MTGPEKPADVSSGCPSCGAGMQVDHDAGVMRCPYCGRETLIPGAQTAGAAWPFGTTGTGMPQITITTNRAFTQTPEEVRRRILIALFIGLGTFLVMMTIMSSTFSSIGLFSFGSSSEEVEVGTTVEVQSFEATVHGMDCTKKTIAQPDDPATSYAETGVETAEGKFCVISFSVRNVGEKTDSYPTSSIEATSPTERVFDRRTFAEIYANNGARKLDEPIDPGKTVDQFLVFDVPVDTTLAYLRVSDDLFGDSDIKVKFGS